MRRRNDVINQPLLHSKGCGRDQVQQSRGISRMGLLLSLEVKTGENSLFCKTEGREFEVLESNQEMKGRREGWKEAGRRQQEERRARGLSPPGEPSGSEVTGEILLIQTPGNLKNRISNV